ncbi:NUDIX domain-containing protein [Streptomyces sp. NPDC100445]|uniref:NUDIX domain-containing protein n=1 Tax=Streptomyces sp. NPDC100445 TaxID=3366102 RepID=UPI003801D795
MVRPLPRGFRVFTLQFPTSPLASPGGGVDPGESPAAAASRELMGNSASKRPSTRPWPSTGSPPTRPPPPQPCGSPANC